MRTIIVTGATGFLGSNLVSKLINEGNTKVIAVLGRSGAKTNSLPTCDNLVACTGSALLAMDLGHVDALIHTAFSRGDNLAGLTASINHAREIIELVNHRDIDAVLNISTQGVYPRLRVGEKVNEESAVGPNTVYGLGKWAVENMIEVGCKKQHTSIRLASLSANAKFLDFFVNKVMAHQEITVVSPRQYASIMDITDAIEGIMAILQLPIHLRKKVYNLGPGVQYSILDYAQTANEVWEAMGHAPTDIIVEDSGIEFAICMNCTRLEAQTGWKPMVTKNMMIKKMFERKD